MQAVENRVFAGEAYSVGRGAGYTRTRDRMPDSALARMPVTPVTIPEPLVLVSRVYLDYSPEFFPYAT